MFFSLLYLFVELFPSNFKLAVFRLKTIDYQVFWFVLIATLFYWNRPKYCFAVHLCSSETHEAFA